MTALRRVGACGLAAVSMSLSAGHARAQFAADSFLYTLNIDLEGASGGTGWDDSWFDGIVNGNLAMRSVGPGLFYPGLLSGGAALECTLFATFETRLNRGMVADYASASGGSSEFWISVLVRHTDPSPDPGSVASVYLSRTSNTGFARALLMPGQNIVLEASNHTMPATVIDSADTGKPLVTGQTHLLVMHCQLENQTMPFQDLPDAISLWVDPDLSAPLGAPDATLGHQKYGMDRASFRFTRVQPAGLLFDEIRIGQSSASVLPAGSSCAADVNGDGSATPADFTAWLSAFNTMTPACDQNGDGLCTPSDFTAWVANYNLGCP